MKIGIVSNFYPPDARGGAELIAQRVADALYKRGHQVFVLSTKPYNGIRSLFPCVSDCALAVVYRFFPCNIYYARNSNKIPLPVRLLWHFFDLVNPFSRTAIRHLIETEKPDAIITHNLKGIGVSIGSEIQKQNVTHVHTLHDIQLSIPSGVLIAGEENSLVNRSFLRRAYEWLAKREIGNPDIVISPSKFLSDFYRERGFFTNSRVEVIQNPLPFGSQTTPGQARPDMKTKFLYVGQLEKHKGLPFLLDCLDSLGDEIEIHIAGEGSLSELVADRALRDRRVIHHGFVPFDHLIKLLDTIDCVIVPSICYENSPTVIYESILVGVPIIASRIGGIPELIKEGETGLLVKPGDKDELVAAMRRIHDEREIWWSKWKEISDNAGRFSIVNYVDRLLKLIEEAKSPK